MKCVGGTWDEDLTGGVDMAASGVPSTHPGSLSILLLWMNTLVSAAGSHLPERVLQGSEV